MRSPLSHRLQYALALAFFRLLGRLPRRLRGAIGISLGQIIYFLGIRTKVTKQNLARAFPRLPIRAVDTLAARTYRHFGTVAASLTVISRLSQEAEGHWIYTDQYQALQEALAEGRGCLVFSGHLGNWEIMGAMAAQCGLPVTFVVTTQTNKRIEALLDDIRRSAGVQIVKRKDAMRGVLSALKHNRCVALLIDQDAHEDGAFVPFFGQLASTPRGPAVFHLKTGAPLVFAHCVRLPGERYRIHTSRLDTAGTRNADELTALMTAKLESAIRETPEQWFWMHRRWKTLPPVS